MKIRFIDTAVQEAREARTFYSEESNKLGDDFQRELRMVLDRIRYNPRAWPIVREDVRRLPMNRFPYWIYYFVEMNKLVVSGVAIVAVYHNARRSIDWSTRLKGT